MSTTEKHEVRDIHAAKFAEWIATRGGLLIWRSHDLSNPGQSVTTPFKNEDGTPVTSPHWRYTANPERHITDANEVEVTVDEPVETFTVHLKRQNMKLVLTAASSRKVREAEERAGRGSFHEFGAGPDNVARSLNGLSFGEDQCTIYRPAKTIPLPEWIAQHQPATKP